MHPDLTSWSALSLGDGFRHIVLPDFAFFYPSVCTDISSRYAHRLARLNTSDINHKFRSKSNGNYKLIKRVKLDFTDVVMSKWKSNVTGLSVIHLDYQAPIVSGYFVVATETFDDSGCSHTLEHLVSLGSEKHPHMGTLAQLANRVFAQSPNAWTCIDHTCYTMSTAGGQGFLQLLPIYVDHILYPTITDSSFVTEVHHIDGKGHDSGVVYCEMQSRENTPGDLMSLRLRHLLSAVGSGYRSDSGGLMEALRVLTPEQIRKYHANYYVPHNLVVIVGGSLIGGTSSLLRVVQEQVEPSLIQHNQNKGSCPAGWKRPFVETQSAQREAIPATTKSVIEFPDKDETMGEIIIFFYGPPPNDFLTRQALHVLAQYLTSSTAAPLNKEYIEIESPLCSYFSFLENARATNVDLSISIGSVPTKNLDTFNEQFTASLKRIVGNGIDMQRMAMVINKAERQLRCDLEYWKGMHFSGIIFDDFLYGAEDGSELRPAMDRITNYNILRSWNSRQWTELLSKFYVEQPSIAILGKPSASLADNLEKAEKARIADRVEKLGTEGLKEAERKLEAAKEANNKPIPAEILTSFPVPDMKGICWIPVQTVQEAGEGRIPNPNVSTDVELQKHIGSDGKPLPFFVEYDHVESAFVSVHAYCSLAKLPNHLRPYMAAYLWAFFSLPVVRHNGARLTHDDVINQLDNDTVGYYSDLGVLGYSINTFRVGIKVELAAYETAVAWLRDLLYGSEFDKERIQVVLAQSKPTYKEAEWRQYLWLDLMHTESSTSKCESVLAQAAFIPALIQKLQESPESVVADFSSIRKHIIDPSGVRFSVLGNILGIKHPRNAWAKYFGPLLPPTPLSPVPLSNQTLSAVGRNCLGQAIVTSLPTTESSYVLHTTQGIQGFDHPEYPVIRLALEILNALEGYLWRPIRGSGLAYTAFVGLNNEAGLLTFSLLRSSNPIKAFEEASSVMNGLVDGSIELTDNAVTAALSAVVYDITESLSTPSNAALNSFINQAIKGVSRSDHIDLLEKIQTIKKEDIIAAFQKHFMPLFNPASSAVVVVTAPGNVQSIREGLTNLGFSVTQKELHTDPTGGPSS